MHSWQTSLMSQVSREMAHESDFHGEVEARRTKSFFTFGAEEYELDGSLCDQV